MKLKRNVLLCLALLLVAGLLTMQNYQLHFTPQAAYEDACMGLIGRVRSTVGVYDAGDRQYFLSREDDLVSVHAIRRTAGCFWTTGSSSTSNVHGNRFCSNYIVLNSVPLAYAIPLDPEVDRICLRLDQEDGPSKSLSTAPPYGDLYFWYLPGYSPGEDPLDALRGYTLVFSAYASDGTLLDEVCH